MKKWSPKSETTRKNKQDRSCWKILTLVKVNSQQSTIGMLTYAEVTLGLTPAICGRCVWHVGARVVRDGDEPGAWGRGRAWQSVVARGAHAREAETSAGALGRVWGGFWPFLVGFFLGLSVLSLYAFALAVGWAKRWDPRVTGLWAWRRWLAFNSDYWMKARAAKERRRCPQEPESQRNGFDTMLTI